MELPDQLVKILIPLAAAQGIDLGVASEGSDIGDEKPVFPAVNLNRAVSDIAHETGMNLKRSGLYIYQDRLVTVGEDGRDEEMDCDRFRTWIDRFQINFYRRRKSEDGDENERGMPVKATMKADVAKVLLRSDEFRCHLPEIAKILPVRLPVWETVDEVLRLRILPFGYDAESKVYCSNTGIKYDADWTVERAVEYLRRLLKDFPYGDTGRSLSVQISAMLTCYAQLLFAPLDRFPMIFYNANQPGSGKTRLAELSVYMVYGEADSIDYSDNDEFVKRLDTWAQSGRGYTFFDDVSGLVKSNQLNRWLTSPTWSWRIMHSQKQASVRNQTMTLLTANQATLSDDLVRRALMVDLWSSELALDRQGRMDFVIDAEWMAKAENRQDILAALHALAAAWVEAGAIPSRTLLPSFEGWSRIVPAIVRHAGFDCPLQKPNVQDAGGKQEVEFMRMLTAAVKDYEIYSKPQVDILLTDWCRLAREIGVFHGVIGDATMARETLDAMPKLYKPARDKDGNERTMTERDREDQAFRYMDRSQSTKFSKLLNRFYRGQIRTIDGKRYKFADREAKYSTFSVESELKADRDWK